jgi:site-specific DNA recombinase
MVRVAIYTRLSLDRTGEQTATSRQEASCRAHAEARGWSVVEVLEDVDLSAYKRTVRRPSYEQLLELVRTEALDGVLVWKLDRLVRRPAEFERFWAACESSGTFLASVTEPIDSSTEIGLALVRVLVTFAGLESSTIGLRISARLRQKAEQGAPPSIPRPMGHTADWQALVPDEAALIREAARRIIAGESMKAIALSWQERGLRRHRGGPWSGERVGDVLRSRRLVGDRVFRGEVVATDCFPPILDRVTWAKVQVALARRTSKPNAASPYLLSGLLMCGECGGRLYGRKTHPPSYACAKVPGCGRNASGAGWLEDWVISAVMHRLGCRRQHLDHRRIDLVAVDEHVERLRSLSHDYFMGAISDRPTYLAARAALRRAHDEQLTSVELGVGVTRQLEPMAAQAAWPSLDVERRRSVIASELDHLVVQRSGGRRMDTSRLQPVWARPDPPALTPFVWQPPRVPHPPRADRWLSETETVNYVGLSRETVRRLLRNGSIPSESHRGRTRVRRSDAEAFIESQRV